MQRVIIAIAAAVAILSGEKQTTAQTKQRQDPIAERYVVEAAKQPKLGIEYDLVTRFKIASRKTTYHIGEMIGVDLAMLNITDTPIFVHNLGTAVINVRDQANKEVRISPYLFIDRFDTAKSYELLQPNQMIISWRSLLAGCDELAFEQSKKDFGETNDKKSFEEDRFINWGYACLKLTGVGTYAITAEIVNRNVILSSNDPGRRTTTGTIRSTPLTIRIIE